MKSFPIPHDYIWMAKQSSKPRELYTAYVVGYAAKVYPEYRVTKIEGRTAYVEKSH